MKKLLVLALLAAGQMSNLVEAKQDSPSTDRKLCCNPKRLPESKNGLITIDESGAYKLTENITADILIDADDVCLDLNCFTLTGDSSFFAILANDHTNITIKNGTIKNPGFGGIGLFGCSQLHLEGLKLNPVDIAIVIIDSPNNITSDGCLKDIDVSGNTTTIFGVIIGISNGHTFSLTNIDASHCTVNRSAPSFLSGLVNILGVDNVSVSCCKINNNQCADLNPFVPLLIAFGDEISVEDTEVNDNRVINPAPSAGMVAAYFSSGRNYCIKRCQFNRSTVERSSTCYGLFSLLISNLLIDCCEANDTTLKNALPGPFTPVGNIGAGATGIFIVGASLSPQGFKVLNSKANGTTHNVNQAGQNQFSGPEGIFLLGAVNGTVEKCQANRTKVKSGQAFNACGLLTSFCSDVHVSKSEALNTSASNAYGFAAIAPNTDVIFSDSIGSDASGTFFAAGFITLFNTDSTNPVSPNVNVSFKNNCAQNNNAPIGFGFLLSGDTTNCSITNSQAQDNSAAGIQIGEANEDQTHLNPKIICNCSQVNGAGFVVEGTGNTISNPQLLDNKAINNTNCGFEQSGTVTNPTYKRNKAQGNGTDFCTFTNAEGNKIIKGTLTCKDK